MWLPFGFRRLVMAGWKVLPTLCRHRCAATVVPPPFGRELDSHRMGTSQPASFQACKYHCAGMDSDEKKYDALTEWAKEHGAALHPSIEIRLDPEMGASFKVREARPEMEVQPGGQVVTCPMSLTLSYLNSLPTPPQHFHKDARPFPSRFLASTPPHVISRFLLMKEYLAGTSSFWSPYIRILPQPENLSGWSLPPFWPADDQELLEGTNLDATIQEIKARLKAEFKAARKILEEDMWENWRDYTRILHHWAYSMFTSRSFMPSLVVPNCESIMLPGGVKWDDFSLLLPLFDIGNHSITAKVSWEVDSVTGTCKLLTGSGYRPGEQVFNNYGMKTNSQLLLAYGFMIPEAEQLHNDYIHVRKRTDVASEALTRQQYILSLRPMTDPSSVLGRALQPVSLELIRKGKAVLSPFTHIQESMVLDLIAAQSPGLVSEGGPDRIGILEQFLMGEPDDPVMRPLLERTVAIVQHKALQELERLEETDVEVREEDDEDLTRNQRLALGYRRQCMEILHRVLSSIEGFEGDDEDENAHGGGQGERGPP
jgi:protein-histidine N-methyltransferase